MLYSSFIDNGEHMNSLAYTPLSILDVIVYGGARTLVATMRNTASRINVYLQSHLPFFFKQDTRSTIVWCVLFFLSSNLVVVKMGEFGEALHNLRDTTRKGWNGKGILYLSL